MNIYQVIDLEGCRTESKCAFALDVLNGLSKQPREIPSKYLYDTRGSYLFEQITELPEYYQTQSEIEIIRQRIDFLRQLISPAPFRLVELGVGDGRKTKLLIQDFLKHGIEFEYAPIDVCPITIEKVVDELKQDYSHTQLKVLGIIADYSEALQWIGSHNSKRNIVLFLGSSIGNFDKQQIVQFLHQMWVSLNEGDIAFIGFDLKKSLPVLERAYNDSAGVTKEFNLNLLDRINRELEGDFVRENFDHYSFYNPAEGRMESWLMSRKNQKVFLRTLQKTFEFEAWEGIHVENSYKYNLKDLKHLADQVGFVTDTVLLDSKNYFAEAIWQIKKIDAAIGAFI